MATLSGPRIEPLYLSEQTSTACSTVPGVLCARPDSRESRVEGSSRITILLSRHGSQKPCTTTSFIGSAWLLKEDGKRHEPQVACRRRRKHATHIPCAQVDKEESDRTCARGGMSRGD